MRKLWLMEAYLPKITGLVGDTEWYWKPKLSDSKVWYKTITVQTL